MNDDTLPVLYGGLGEKVSNGGTQYYFQDRVYDVEHCAISMTAAFAPWYLICLENNHENENK